jgi:dolichyl-phosphate-mannose-protein mannosyltransferase
VILLLLGSEGVLFLIKLFQKHKNPLQKVAAFVARSITLIALVGLVYLTSYTQMFLQGKDSAHFLELFKQTWSYQTHLDATHPYQSKPMQWFLNTKPVWFWVQYDSDSSRSDIYALGNPLLFVLADTSLIGFLIWTLYTKGKKLTKPLILLFSAYGIVWLPWALSPRIMFFYHYTPAVPFLCIFFAWFLHSLWQYPYKTAQTQKVLRSSIVGMIALIALTAVLWFPHWTGIPMPTWFKNTVYFAVPSWK